MTLPPSLAPLREPAWQLRVLDGDGFPVGGAVHMSPRFLVTCAHVVNTALGLPAGAEEHPGERARVRLAQSHGPVWEASVGTEVWSAGHGEIDVAVLWLTSAGFPDTGHPVRVAGSRLRQGEPLRTTGYPDGFALHSSLLYLGPAGPSRASHQATLPENEVQPITEGFSGCAAITGSGELVGIVQQNHFHAHDGDRPSGTAFILTTDDMPDGHHAGRRDHRSGTGPVPRLTDEALCGEVAYERLHDFLDSVPGTVLPHTHLLDDEELRRTRERIGQDPSAWQVLMGLWNLVPAGDAPPLRLVWVHHALQELRSRRPVPPSAGRWLREEAREHLGDGWEQELDSELTRRLSARASSPEVSAAGDGTVLRADRRPDTVVLFDVEPVTGGYKLSHGIAHRSGQGYEHREQATMLVQRYQLRDRVGDLVSRASFREGLTPERGSPRLSFLLPKRLLGLDLGSVTGHHGDRQDAPTLAEEYELVYHVRERVRPPRPAPGRERLWRVRTARQHERPLLSSETLLTTWDRVGEEVRAALTDEEVTVCVVESDRTDTHSVYDAVLESGIPTVLRGPRPALLTLIGELLTARSEEQRHVWALPSLLRERAERKQGGEGIMVVHDEYGDALFRGVSRI
ncbi:trypsin-like peptidase domain-containing protein [Nocardiopsis kunsanensis]|uniref:trypsin-like peptidase domain-containing protein n=1 Tax=Nocardiopsis kunsanensis TaxID=141693 RepID=UPI0003473F27|nr:trypsin-like peptidase domain-containing protein [Nocardiopsis kunsanensis]